jgi:8-oxo-dGTP diphosphatase
MQEYVLGFMFNETADQVLLIRKATPDWQAGRLDGIRGKVADSETPLDAMVREFLEQTGILVEEWEPTIILRGQDAIGYCFRDFSKDTVLHRAVANTITNSERCEIAAARFLPSSVLPNLYWLVSLHGQTCTGS